MKKNTTMFCIRKKFHVGKHIYSSVKLSDACNKQETFPPRTAMGQHEKRTLSRISKKINGPITKEKEYQLWLKAIKKQGVAFTPAKGLHLIKRPRIRKTNGPITKAQIIATQKIRQSKKDKYKHANPSGLVKIYAKVTRIEAQKGNSGNFPGEKFYHNFKRPYPSLYGTPDRKTLVIK